MTNPTQCTGVKKVFEGRSIALRRLRLALDCILILLVILIASGNRVVVQAGFNRQGSSASYGVITAHPAAISSPVEAQPVPVLLDNKTLAAVIAAENGALTPPLYFSTLPLIER